MKKVDTEKALDYLLEVNQPHLTAWVGYLKRENSEEEVLQAIKPFQNPDGGWARIDADLNVPHSTISNTWLGLQWLIWLDVKDHEMLKNTLHFLRVNQKKDGSWDEPEELAQYDPPSWMMPGNHATQLWLTSAVCCKILELSQELVVEFEEAISYLRNGWQNNRFPTYRHTHWMGLAVFSRYHPEVTIHQQIAAGCKEFLIAAINEEQVDPADFSEIVYSSLLAGRFAGDLFQLAMPLMLENQMGDGGWGTNYGEQHRPGITLYSLLLLKKLKQI